MAGTACLCPRPCLCLRPRLCPHPHPCPRPRPRLTPGQRALRAGHRRGPAEGVCWPLPHGPGQLGQCRRARGRGRHHHLSALRAAQNMARVQVCVPPCTRLAALGTAPPRWRLGSRLARAPLPRLPVPVPLMCSSWLNSVALLQAVYHCCTPCSHAYTCNPELARACRSTQRLRCKRAPMLLVLSQ